MKFTLKQFFPVGELGNGGILIPCKETTETVKPLLNSIQVLESLRKVDFFIEFAAGNIRAKPFAIQNFSGEFSYDFIVDLKTQPEWLKSLLGIAIPTCSLKMTFFLNGDNSILKKMTFATSEILNNGGPGSFFGKAVENPETNIKQLDLCLKNIFHQMYILSPSRNLFDFASLKNSTEFKKVLKDTSDFLALICKKNWRVFYSADTGGFCIEQANLKTSFYEANESLKFNTSLGILASCAKSEYFNQMPVVFILWPEKFSDKMILKATLESFSSRHINYILLTESPDILAIHTKLKGRVVKLNPI